MAIDIQIEGVSYVAGPSAEEYAIDLESVSADLDIAAQQPNARFTLKIWNQAITRPLGSQMVVMYDADGSRQYGGVVNMVQEKELAPTLMEYTVTIGDWSLWFDAHLVKTVYDQLSVSGIVTAIVDTYVNVAGTTRIFSTSGIQSAAPDPIIPIMQFAYLTPSECIGQLCQLTGYGFYVDEFMDVQFYPVSGPAFPSPLAANTLDADVWYNNPSADPGDYPDWMALTVGEDVSQVKNVVYVTGIYTAANQTWQDKQVADGTSQVYPMKQEAPDNVSAITVSVGGVFYAVALDYGVTQDTQPNTAYVNFTNQTITFATPPAQNAALIFTYYPMVQTVVSKQDTAAIAYMAARDGTDGQRQYNRLDPNLSAQLPTLAYERAVMTLNKWAYPYKTLEFTSYLSGWKPGQAFTFLSQRRFDGDYNGLAFHVLRVSKTIVQAEASDAVWKYTVTCATIPYEV